MEVSVGGSCVKVAVGEGVKVGVEVSGNTVKVAVGIQVALAVGERVGVRLLVGVLVWVLVGVPVGVPVKVPVAVAVIVWSVAELVKLAVCNKPGIWLVASPAEGVNNGMLDCTFVSWTIIQPVQ